MVCILDEDRLLVFLLTTNFCRYIKYSTFTYFVAFAEIPPVIGISSKTHNSPTGECPRTAGTTGHRRQT
jgi:hypothetical protein